MRVTLPALLLTLAAAPVLAQSNTDLMANDHYTRSHDYDLVHQRIAVSAFNWDSLSFEGGVTTTLVARRPGLDAIILDEGTLLVNAAVTDRRGVALRTSRSGDTLVVFPASPVGFGDTLVFTVAYHGKVVNGGGLTYITSDGLAHRPRQIWSQGEDHNNHLWFPTFDFPSDKMSWEVVATVPQEDIAVSNGRLVSDMARGGTRTMTWSQEQPSATYLVSLIVAPLVKIHDTWQGIPVDYYVYREDSSRAWRLFHVTPDMIGTYSDLTGVRYPWAKYAQTTVADFFGGMENVSATTLVDWLPDERAYLDRPWYQSDLIPHELAHQWFGDYVTTINWANMWLNEGFAEFMPGQYWGRKLGPHAEQAYYGGEYGSYRRIEGRSSMPLASLGSNNIYSKGALVLEMLKQYLGPERFWASIHAYLSDHAFGVATSDDLRQAVQEAREYDFLAQAARLHQKLLRERRPEGLRRVRVALLSSSTANFLAPLLALACFRDGLDAEVYVGPYGNYRQEIMDEQSGLYAFKPDVVVIATHWRDADLPALADDPEPLVEERARAVRDLWELLLSRRTCSIIQHGFDLPAADSYGHLASALKGGRVAMLRLLNRRLAELTSPEVAILDLDTASAFVGRARWSDDALWHAAKQHPSAEGLPFLADRQVALLRAALGLTKKVLAVDLDNTLWGGVIGEDGLGGIAVGPPSALGEAHAALQRYLRELRERGILLGVSSKNNDADARLPFERHDGMVLKLDDFAVFRANWLDKPTNLRQMAISLNLGLDSFVLLDDNPAERALVRERLPEVAVPELGSDPATFAAALDRHGYFEAWSLSAEDRSRHRSYRTNVAREELRASATSVEEFLGSLQMVCECAPFDELVLPRVVQLLGKTNQFNVTTRRHNEAQVRRIMTSEGWWTQYFKLRDRFGDHGLIGLLVARDAGEEPRTWEIDTWLMSCRVIGRKMEDFMITTLIEEARRAGVRLLRGVYIPTDKNVLVKGLFTTMGFREVDCSSDGAQSFVLALERDPLPCCRFIERLAAEATAT